MVTSMQLSEVSNHCLSFQREKDEERETGGSVTNTKLDDFFVNFPLCKYMHVFHVAKAEFCENLP